LPRHLPVKLVIPAELHDPDLSYARNPKPRLRPAIKQILFFDPPHTAKA
jgi:hypothetical protein